jgi:hypothetical protein
MAAIVIADVHPTLHLCRTWRFEAHKSPKNDFMGATKQFNRVGSFGPKLAPFRAQISHSSQHLSKVAKKEQKPSNPTFFSTNPQICSKSTFCDQSLAT